MSKFEFNTSEMKVINSAVYGMKIMIIHEIKNTDDDTRKLSLFKRLKIADKVSEKIERAIDEKYSL